MTCVIHVQAAGGVSGEPIRATTTKRRAPTLPWHAPAPQISRTNETNPATSPAYSFQPNGTTRRGRIDSPVAEQRPSPHFFDYTAPSGESSFAPAPAAPSSAPSDPIRTVANPRGSEESAFNTTHPPKTFSAGYALPLQSGTVDVQPASGASGMGGLLAAASGGAVQVASGRPGAQPLAGGAVNGASAAPAAGAAAPAPTLLVAPEGQGPSVKAGRLSPDAPTYAPPSVRTGRQGMFAATSLHAQS